MRIVIKENRKTMINLWIPNFNWVFRLAIGVISKQKDVQLTPAQRQAFLKMMKKIKRQYKGLVLIDIKTKAGETVYVKL
jgi:hypothetical protein